MKGILDQVRVIDLSWGLAGPVATLLLAEAGADVVKVEPPDGDPFRVLSPPGFATWNRSKRSLVLDSWDGLHELLHEADVLVHALRPADAVSHGLDDASLRERHPGLIVSSILGYPLDGPDAERAGWDACVQARLGIMDEQAGHRAGPVLLRFPIASWGAAYLCAAGVLARLIARGRGLAGGGHAHTSLLQGALVTMTMHWARASTPTPSFAGGLPKGMAPSLYECGDGVWIHVMGIVHELPPLLDAIGALDPSVVEAARAAPTSSYYPDHNVLVLAFRTRSSREWCEELWRLDVPVLPAQRLGEILHDEQAKVNGYVVEVDDPELGLVTMAGPPLHCDPPMTVRGPAPRLGQHGATSGSGTFAGHRVDLASTDAPPVSGVAPLAGLKVLDCGSFLAGPFACMLLADLGADVIKLETTTGDPMRPVERVFAGCQRGKRSIALNLKEPASRPVLEALLGWADVVHHNLRMPAARKLGLDEDAVRAVNGAVVYCHTSAYGPLGPRADWPGFDQLFQAFSGWEAEGGGEGNPPMWHRMGMMDHQSALASLVATLLGVYRRDRTGEGQSVRASILGAACLTAGETVLRADGSTAPYALLDATQSRLIGGDEVDYGIVADTATVRVGLDGFEPAEEEIALDQMAAFFDDPDNQRTRLAVAYEHPTWGHLEQIGALWSFGDDLALALDTPPPTLGQHSEEILAELGLASRLGL
ncbi:MAG: CoA transferase [Acidimicrobiales bacterium]